MNYDLLDLVGMLTQPIPDSNNVISHSITAVFFSINPLQCLISNNNIQFLLLNLQTQILCVNRKLRDLT